MGPELEKGVIDELYASQWDVEKYGFVSTFPGTVDDRELTLQAEQIGISCGEYPARGDKLLSRENPVRFRRLKIRADQKYGFLNLNLLLS